ncbi:MAG: aminoacyl-histidine dipeptidase, partial [Clostridia bacterium]|nr:aminoacyl-histidine dipeptidase [Clostridia bacterium]
MAVLSSLEPKQVFKYFEEISSVPRGSGNMNGIADFCVNFAEKHGLKFIRDNANNVVIYKDAAKGYESAEPIILQGHLDMVCQKDDESSFDFEKDGIELLIDGEFIKANGTTLGADNGIAV